MLRKAIVRDWRDASTLMLVARTPASPFPCTCGRESVANDLSDSLRFHTIFPDPETRTYNYVDAKSLLMEKDNDVGVDFKTLMLTRSAKSKFMPNALVFPGGVVDDSDKSGEWHRVFQRVMGSNMPDPPSSTTIPPEQRPPMFAPPMFTPHESQPAEAVDLDLAFRICAIRETFEEIGILLVRNAEGSRKHGLNAEETSTWRRFVHKNGENFRRLCEEVNMVPDVWSLYEWSNWLTPIRLNAQRPLSKDVKRTPRRFDTMFYVAMLDTMPTADSYAEDDAEVVKAQWLNPFQALNLHYSASAWMAPPQIYEQARLVRLSGFEAISRFSASRQEFGLMRWLPVAVNAADGVASVLPGDSLYPTDPSFDFNNDEPPVFHGTLNELRKRTDHHHRFEIRSGTDCTLLCNTGATNNHIMPLSVLQSKAAMEFEDI